MIGDGRGTKMRPFRETIPIGEALRIVEAAARPLERTVRVGLAEAHGRVLADGIVAARDVPPFDRAAMSFIIFSKTGLGTRLAHT